MPRDVGRDGTTVRTRRPLVIDVGAVGKGYLVDIVAAILRDAGVDGFLVDASGDLRHSGQHATRIGLADPHDPGLVIGAAELRDQALCTSGTAKRAWGGGLHHLLDARTGRPVRDVQATWVVADGLSLAGCASTTEPGPPSTSDSETGSGATAEYADGDYDATGWYGGQPSRIGVAVSLADGVINAALEEIKADAVTPGSYLVLSHIAAENTDEQSQARNLYQKDAVPILGRTREQLAAFFTGMEIVEPGMVWTPQWHPETSDNIAEPERSKAYAAVGRKP